MSARSNGGYVFPIGPQDSWGGLSRLDYFAAAALTGMLAKGARFEGQSINEQETRNAVACVAVDIARAMLAEIDG